MNNAVDITNIPYGSSLQQYLDITGLTLKESVHPRFLTMVETWSDGDLSKVPWGVVLLDGREPTKKEIARGQELERKINFEH